MVNSDRLSAKRTLHSGTYVEWRTPEMTLDAVQEHWLFSEFFREPEGGWLGWGIFAAAIVLIAYQVFIGNFWMIPLIAIPLAEVYPTGDAETAGLLRLIGVVYIVIFGLYLVLTLFIL